MDVVDDMDDSDSANWTLQHSLIHGGQRSGGFLNLVRRFESYRGHWQVLGFAVSAFQQGSR